MNRLSKEVQNRDFRHLKQPAKGDRRLSAAKIASDLNGSFAKPITTTVCRYLRNLGFEYVIKIKRTMAQ